MADDEDYDYEDYSACGDSENCPWCNPGGVVGLRLYERRRDNFGPEMVQRLDGSVDISRNDSMGKKHMIKLDPEDLLPVLENLKAAIAYEKRMEAGEALVDIVTDTSSPHFGDAEFKED